MRRLARLADGARRALGVDRVFVGSAAWLIVAQVSGRLSVVLAGMFVATRFGSASFASFSYVNLTGATIATICSLGVGMAVTRSFARLRSADPSDTGDVAALTVLLGVTSLAGLVAGFAIAESSVALQRATDRTVLAVVSGLSVATGFLAGALAGLERFRELALANLAAAAGLCVLIVASSLLNSSGAAVASLAVAQAGLFGVAAASLRDQWRTVFHSVRHVTSAQFSRAISIAGPISLVSALFSGAVWAVGQAQVSREDQGLGFAIYAAGFTWFSICLFLPSIAGQVVAPRLFRGLAGQASDTYWRQTLATTLLTVVLALPVCGAVLVGSGWVAAAYGPSMAGLREPLTWFVAAALLAAPCNVLGTAIVAAGGQWTWLVMTAVWTVVFFVGFIALRGSAGYSGAPQALLLAYALHLTVTVWQSARRYNASRRTG